MADIVRLRALTSSALAVTFLMVLVTGIGLYFAPSGRTARLDNWHFFLWNRMQLENLHTIAGFLMSAVVGIHLILNYRMFAGELRSLLRKLLKKHFGKTSG